MKIPILTAIAALYVALEGYRLHLWLNVIRPRLVREGVHVRPWRPWNSRRALLRTYIGICCERHESRRTLYAYLATTFLALLCLVAGLAIAVWMPGRWR